VNRAVSATSISAGLLLPPRWGWYLPAALPRRAWVDLHRRQPHPPAMPGQSDTPPAAARAWSCAGTAPRGKWRSCRRGPSGPAARGM